jgi:hypothetical protein
MIIHPDPQGSEGWVRARLGIPTASCFHLIVTPKRLQLSEARHKYKYKLLAEWLTGQQQDEFADPSMQRGSELEARAVAYYSFKTGREVDPVGLCLTDDERIGCSPDGLIGDEGGLEIKCPMAPQCVAFLCDEHIEENHRMQIQGGLFVTRRKWWDAMAWNPYIDTFPPKIVRVDPDPKAQQALSEFLPIFLDEIELAKQHLLAQGCIPIGVEV